MMRYGLLILLICGWSAGCAPYSTHMGRVGEAQRPAPLGDAPSPPIQAVAYGGAPFNRAPELAQPLTRTVWIKGRQSRPGEYVGDYPLTLVFTRAEFVREQDPPHPVVPHAIEIDDTAPSRPSAAPLQGQRLPALSPSPPLNDRRGAMGHPSAQPPSMPNPLPPRLAAGQALRHQLQQDALTPGRRGVIPSVHPELAP
jgi:hypothetical protein